MIHHFSPFLETPWPEDGKEAIDEGDEDDDEVVYENGDSHQVDEQLPTLTLAQVKFEPTKSCIVGCVFREHDNLLPEPDEPVAVPDTIEAHLELVRERESKLKMKEEVWDQVTISKKLYLTIKVM
jgi:hypothetical protein